MSPEDMELSPEEMQAAREKIEGLLKEAAADPETRAELEKLGFSVVKLMKSHVAPKAQRLWKAVGPEAKQLGKTMLGASAVAAGFGAINKGTEQVEELIGNFGSAKKKAHAYLAMMRHNPGLKEYDSRQIQAAFNTLHRFNPEYAVDPLVSGSFVQQVLESERVPLQTVNELVRARQSLSGSGKKRSVVDPALARYAERPEEPPDHYNSQYWSAS